MTMKAITLTIATTMIMVAGSVADSCSAKDKSQAMVEDITMTTVGLPDGRGLTCALYAPNSDIGTIDCDWPHASKKNKTDANSPLGVKTLTSPDGRSVICVLYAPNWSVGSISCDWPPS
jgi:hypothetical protein